MIELHNRASDYACSDALATSRLTSDASFFPDNPLLFPAIPAVFRLLSATHRQMNEKPGQCRGRAWQALCLRARSGQGQKAYRQQIRAGTGQLSNTDSFIDEVNEELKRDRLFGLMRRYGWIAVVAVLAIVGFAGWNEWSKARNEAAAQAFGDGVITALNNDDPAAQRSALTALAGEQAGTGREGQGRLAIVNLLLAAQSLEEGDRPGALSALQAVADDTALPDSYRQLATLKRVIIAGPGLPLAEREAALAPLAAAGQAYRPLALEQLALLRVEAGETEAALAQFRALLSEPDLTGDLRRRVTQVIVVLGGEVGTDLG